MTSPIGHGERVLEIAYVLPRLLWLSNISASLQHLSKCVKVFIALYALTSVLNVDVFFQVCKHLAFGLIPHTVHEPCKYPSATTTYYVVIHIHRERENYRNTYIYTQVLLWLLYICKMIWKLSTSGTYYYISGMFFKGGSLN